MDLTPEEAAKLAGFSVKLPGYLPDGDYYLAGISYATEKKYVTMSFHGKSGHPIFVTMSKGDIGKAAAGLTKITFAKGTAYTGQKKDQFGERNVFLWEEEKGVIYEIASSLDGKELEKFAQSVGQGNYETIKKAIPVKGFEAKGNLTVQEASDMSGIPIKLPAYPQGGAPRHIFYTVSYGEEYVLMMYDLPGSDAFLNIEITKANLKDAYGKIPLIDPPHPNGQAVPFKDGIAYTYKLRGSSAAKPELTHFNGFMWEQDEGIVYKMISDLPHEELAKIASSFQ